MDEQKEGDCKVCTGTEVVAGNTCRNCGAVESMDEEKIATE